MSGTAQEGQVACTTRDWTSSARATARAHGGASTTWLPQPLTSCTALEVGGDKIRALAPWSLPSAAKRRRCEQPAKEANPQPGCLRRQQGVGTQCRNQLRCQGRGLKEATRSRLQTRGVEAKLYKLLQKLPADVRRELLEHRFTEGQRLALEQWILEQRRSAHKGSSTTALGHGGPDSMPWGQKARVRPSARSGIVGVQSRLKSGRLFYRASAMMGPFRLTTGYSIQLERAHRHLQVLLRIRDRVAGVADSGTGTGQHIQAPALEQRFRAALAQEPPAVLSTEEVARLRIYFYATIPAGLWVGRRLHTPSFSMKSGGLEAGLRAWRRLSGARGLAYCGLVNRHTILHHHGPQELDAVWGRLRQAYVEIWTEAGQSQQQVAAKLRAMERRHRPCRQRLIARWKKRQLKVEASPGSTSTTFRGSADAVDQIERKVLSLLVRWKAPAPCQMLMPHC
mmetsp:Transcript_124554/g.240315  ORF Transcript_124554/g.240315 Transcript_124554/m.240315 type:complete len:453 (+) Transcript_124554:118-1476(+)